MLATAIWLTIKLALLTTGILMVIGIPLAWKMARMDVGWQRRLRPVIEALVGLPLVLPPTVLGFYLLLTFSPGNSFGRFWVEMTGSTLAFSFSGLLIASVLYSLPFVVQPLQRAFEQFDHDFLEAAAMLGAGAKDRFFNIVLPDCRRAILLSVCLGFAHTVGEFGVVLMIGGNIPGSTQVLSIALYDAVETQQFSEAHRIAGGLLFFSILLLTTIYSVGRKGKDEYTHT